MTLSNYQQNIRIAISLKVFKNRNENFVREEFLVPVFNAAGYDAFGTDIVDRGVNLKKYVTKQKGNRLNIFPDFVLYKNNVPIWVIDAKSPRVKVDSRKNIEQISNYSNYIGCSNAILSNAKETILYKIYGSKVIVIDTFTLKAINNINKFENFINSISPEYAIRNIYSFDESLELYKTDDYVNRSYLMKLLQIYSYSDIEAFLKEFNSSKSYMSKHFRDRALPAILISKYADRDKSLFKRIVDFSLNDSDAIVRENFLTCVISNNASIDLNCFTDYICSHKCETFLEKLLYISFLSSQREGVEFINAKYFENSFLKDYAKVFSKSNPISFPIALLLKKPININYIEYSRYLSFLPSIVENIEQCPNTHYETFKVLNDCLKFAKYKNKNVYKNLIYKASKKQKHILHYFSDDIIL